jgi:hypothetical protein
MKAVSGALVAVAGAILVAGGLIGNEVLTTIAGCGVMGCGIGVWLFCLKSGGEK